MSVTAPACHCCFDIKHEAAISLKSFLSAPSQRPLFRSLISPFCHMCFAGFPLSSPLSLTLSYSVSPELSIHYESHRELRADAVCPTAVPHSIVCFTSPSPSSPSFLLFTSLSGLHLFSTQRSLMPVFSSSSSSFVVVSFWGWGGGVSLLVHLYTYVLRVCVTRL